MNKILKLRKETMKKQKNENEMVDGETDNIVVDGEIIEEKEENEIVKKDDDKDHDLKSKEEKEVVVEMTIS